MFNSLRKFKNQVRYFLSYNNLVFRSIDKYRYTSIVNKNPNLSEKFDIDWLSGDITSNLNSITIVIPYFNSSAMTKELLKEIHLEISSLDGYWSEVVCLVADDHSDEVESQIIQNYCKNLGFLYTHHDKNLGFLSNCNDAYEKCKTDFVLLLNSDVRLPKNFLKRLSNHAKNTNGILTVPSYEDWVTYGADMPTWWELDDALSSFPDSQMEACTAVGYALLINTNNVKSPLFDPEFGHGYGEDSDLHYRVQAQGLNSRITLNMSVFHKGSQSYGLSDLSNSHRQQGKKLFYKKWGKTYQKEFPFFLHSARQFCSQITSGPSSANSLYVLSPSTKSNGIGGLSVIMNAVEQLSLNRVPVRMVDLSLSADDSFTFLSSYKVFSYKWFKKNISSSISPKSKRLVIVGGMDGIRHARAAGLFENPNIKVACLIQGPDFYMEPENSVEFAKAIAEAQFNLVVSDYMESVADYFESQVTIKFNPIPNHFLLGNSSKVEQRQWDVIFSLREEHGKADWLSISIANFLSYKGYKIGTFGLYSDRLSPHITQFGLLPNNELIELFGQAKAFFDSSLYEGFGFVPREALSQGCKVFAIHNGGNEIIPGNGISKFHPWDLVGILRSLEQTLSNYKEFPNDYDEKFESEFLDIVIMNIWKKIA